MNHDKTLFFAGIDWGSASHQVCVTDQIGSTLGEKAFNHTGKGLCEMAQWLIELSPSTADDIAVAIEVPHGPVVETLLERGFRTFTPLIPNSLTASGTDSPLRGPRTTVATHGCWRTRFAQTGAVSADLSIRTPTLQSCGNYCAQERIL